MICVIRIVGRVGNKGTIDDTLNRLHLQRKLHCVLIDEKDKVRMGMLEKVREDVVFGEIDEELIKKLKEKRGQEGKTYFRLHPPIGGFRKSTKKGYPKGILGKNKDIAKLLERML
jgi:ribosomal protein L30/L7E